MPFTRPSLQQIIERILADITGKLGEKASILRRAWTRVWSYAYAGAVHMLHGHISWVKDQFFIESADDEANISKAQFYGITRSAGEFAYGPITITGTLGAPIPASTVFVDSSGARFLTQSPVVIGVGGNVSVIIKAALTGISGNLPAATPLQLESPLPGIDSQALVAVGGVSYGADLETMDSLKARLLARIQTPPQGGSKADYEAWAREEPGLDVVKVYSPGEISTSPMLPPYGYVYVYFSETGAVVPPDQAKIDLVAARIRAKMPVTARLVVIGIQFVDVAFNMQAKESNGYSFTQMRDAIRAELEDLFRDSATPNNVISLSNINEAISRPAAEHSHVLISPASNLTFAYNQVGKVSTITIAPL